jgi:hypothetical protein
MANPHQCRLAKGRAKAGGLITRQSGASRRHALS